MTEFMLFNVQEDWQEENDLAATMPEKLDEMKKLILKTWDDVKTEGPNEWWEADKQKSKFGGKVSY